MFAARDGATDAARALADLGANLNATALPQTDVPLKPEEIAAAQAKNIGTSALVYAIINVHYDLAAVAAREGRRSQRRGRRRYGCALRRGRHEQPAVGAGTSGADPVRQLDGVDLVKRLLAKGANPNARLTGKPLKRHHDAGSTLNFGEGTTPLIRAARTNDVDVMKALLEGGADPFITLPDRTTALMIAAGQGYGGVRGEGIRIVVPTAESAIDALTVLLDRGMDVDAFNNAGNTALHAAVARGDAVVKFLASRGASLNLKNKAGFTPLDIAQGKGGGRGGRGGGVVRESTAALLKQLMEQSGSQDQAPRSPAFLGAVAAQRRRRQPDFPVRFLDLTMALLFAFAAALQFNDPDPIQWIAIYTAACALSLVMFFRRRSAAGDAARSLCDRDCLGGADCVWRARQRRNTGTCSTPGR